MLDDKYLFDPNDLGDPEKVVLIAGPRNIDNIEILDYAIQCSGFKVVGVVSGHARGVDSNGEDWCRTHLGIEPLIFQPDWNDVSGPNARIVHRANGNSYNANAGLDRNKEMAEYIKSLGDRGGVVIIWNSLDQTPGTKNMIGLCKRMKLDTFLWDVGKDRGYFL